MWEGVTVVRKWDSLQMVGRCDGHGRRKVA